MRTIRSHLSRFQRGAAVALLAVASVLGASVQPAQGQLHVWSLGAGDVDFDFGASVAADAAGNVFATGSFQGTIDLGNGPLTSQGGMDIYLVKFDANGNCVWSQSFGNSGTVVGVADVATDASGNVLLAGVYRRTVDFGGGELSNVGWISGWDTYDVFLAKYDGDGNHLWSNGSGGVEDDVVTDLSVDGAGNIAYVGYSGWTASTNHFYDGFLSRFDTSGTLQWTRFFGSSGDEKGLGVDMDQTGNVIMTGSFEGAVDFGGGALTAAGLIDLSDIYLAKYDATGVHLWSQRFGSVEQDEGTAVSVDGAGNIVMTGSFTSNVAFGTTWYSGAGFEDIFVAAFNSSGVNLWADTIGNTGQDRGHSVDFDDAGNVMVTGSFWVSADFGGGPLTSAGYTDIFLASYDPTGNHLWSTRFGGATYDYGQGVCTGGAGELWLTGTFQQTVDFGGGPLTSASPQSDIFVTRFGVPQSAASSLSVRDVPADEGRWVTVQFVRSQYDDLAAPDPLVSYEVFRKEPPPQAPVLVGTITATQQAMYSINVATRQDETPTSYLVHAITAGASSYNSPWATGISLDNLAPAPPTGFSVAYNTGSGNQLAWDPSPEPDAHYYKIYRDTDPGFVPGPSNLAHYTQTTGWTDPDFDGGNVHYKITALDQAENESGPASPVTVTAADPATTAARGFALYQNAPNPFNPSTLIRYDVPAAGGRVTLRVHDAAGRRILTLVDELQTPGMKTVTWNGRDNTGHRVASGVYFYRLQAPDFMVTRKMVLVE